MSDVTASTRLRPVAVATAPAVLLLGFSYHPYVSHPRDEAALAAAAASDTTRWGLSHVVIGLGYALMVLAFIALRSYLREAGEQRWSARALALVALGGAILPILTGMEFALLAAAETGGDVAGAQAELTAWFLPVLLAGGACFAFGAAGFALAVSRSKVMSPPQTRLVAAGLLVMSVARFVPLGAAQPVIGVAAVVALWPLAYRMWQQPVGQPASPA